MTDPDDTISRAEILAVFEELDDPTEPVRTSDVAAAVGCPEPTVQERLEQLSTEGPLHTKQLDAETRVWWWPDGQAVETTSQRDNPTGGTTSSMEPPERDVIEGILEASPVSIVVVEPTGEIGFANRRAEETLGLERTEITDRTYRQPEWNIYFDDGTPVSEEEHPVTRVLETGEPEYGFEHWIELPDGTERWLSSNSAPVLNDAGEVEYVVVGFEDATPLKEREDKLTSDKRRLLELHSEQLFEPFLEAGDGEVRIDVDEVVALPDGTALQYITATGIETKALVAVFERHVAVLDVRLLKSTGAVTTLEVHVEEPTVPLVFDGLGGQVTTLVRADPTSSPVLAGELPGDVDPRTVVTAARDLYPDMRLESQELQYSPKLLYDIVEDALTERQFAALQSAYFGGYFDDPRTSTGEELAARLDITRQTYNQHLRKAERTVLQQLFEASGKGAR